MRLFTITLLLLTIPAAAPADDALPQDEVPDAAENVAEDVEENTPEAKDKNGGIKALLFFAGMIAFGLTVYFTIVQVRRAAVRRRTKLVEAAASKLGLSFQPEGDSTLEKELSPFSLFNIGINREMRNLIVADTDEVSLLVFDFKYEYRGEIGKPNLQFWQTVVAVRSPELQTPTFHLYPERFFSKIASTFGGQDIDFDDHPEFSNAFVLKSEAENETREFFDQPLLDFFAQHPDITLEARPGTILFFRSRKRIEPTATALSKFMEEGLQAFHAVRDRGTERTCDSAQQPAIERQTPRQPTVTPPTQFSLKRPTHWFWRTNFTREQVLQRRKDMEIDDDWFVCPLGDAERAITVGKFASDPDAFAK